MLYWSPLPTSIMVAQLIKDWQEQLAQETDTRKYRLIMLTIAFLQGVQATREEQDKENHGKEASSQVSQG